MIYSIGLDETSSTQIDDYIEEKVIEVLSQAINSKEWMHYHIKEVSRVADEK